VYEGVFGGEARADFFDISRGFERRKEFKGWGNEIFNN
jgi:hypothetical protein